MTSHTAPLMTADQLAAHEQRIAGDRAAARDAYIERAEPMGAQLAGNLCLMIVARRDLRRASALTLAELRQLEVLGYMRGSALTDAGAEQAAAALILRNA